MCTQIRTRSFYIPAGGKTENAHLFIFIHTQPERGESQPCATTLVPAARQLLIMVSTQQNGTVRSDHKLAREKMLIDKYIMIGIVSATGA